MFDAPPNDDEGIAALANTDRVTDPLAVYDDLDALPAWWRELVQEFAEYDLRVYRPSRMADGAILYEVIEELEDRYDIRITVKCSTPGLDEEWRFDVDGQTAVTATHERKPEGYTEYGITESELVEAVASVVEAR